MILNNAFNLSFTPISHNTYVTLTKKVGRNLLKVYLDSCIMAA